MIRMIGLIAFALLITGCNFDENRQLDIRYPATLALKNDSREDIEINMIYNSPESKELFSLFGDSISPGDIIRLRISQGVYEDIRSGEFIIKGVCGNEEDWEVKGTALTQDFVEDESHWSIMVIIKTCGK